MHPFRPARQTPDRHPSSRFNPESKCTGARVFAADCVTPTFLSAVGKSGVSKQPVRNSIFELPTGMSALDNTGHPELSTEAKRFLGIVAVILIDMLSGSDR